MRAIKFVFFNVVFLFSYLSCSVSDKRYRENINYYNNPILFHQAMKKLSDIIFAQKKATENIFNKKNIPFRSFEIFKRDEKTLGELFCFFILETILLGKVMNINPYNQPAVELIKNETEKILS